MSRKRATLPVAAAASPAASTSAIASHRPIPRARAAIASRSSVVLPIPRRGWLTIRRSDTSSAGLSSTCR